MSASDEDLIYEVTMKHTGEVVNVYTEHGANEFLQQCVNDFDLFSSELKKASNIRKKGRKKGKLNAADRDNLGQIYEKLQAVVTSCDYLLFRERVPEEESKAWLSHAAAVFQEVSTSQQWNRTGQLSDHDEMFLSSCCFLMRQSVPANLVLLEDHSFLDSLSALIVARKEASLHPSFARWIEITVDHVFACAIERFDKPWKPEMAFKKLHATGILEHYITCAAVKQHEELMSIKKYTFNYLLTCVSFVKKRFKVGSPCGDALRAVLNGRMEVCPLALPYLQSLLKLSNALKGINPRGYQVCNHCKKDGKENQLMECVRCRQVSYCCKDCQKADWKKHRPVCQPRFKAGGKRVDAVEILLLDYGKKHYVDIMVKIVEKTKNGLGMRDMVLELDFNPDEDGNVPVLQERPPQFKIASNKKYLAAERAMACITRKDLKLFAARLDDRSQSDLVCVTALYDGDKVPCGYQIYEPCSGAAMYTEETLEAFRKAYLEGNYHHLAQIFHKEDVWEYFAEKIEELRATR